MVEPKFTQRPKPPTFPAPAALIDGRYSVQEKLGEGGMGVVVRATDSGLGRDVAVKLILPQLAIQEEVQQRFKEEAHVLAQIRHPHVAQIHTFGEFENVPYFAMEYVPGPSLREWLSERKGEGAPLVTFMTIMDALCRGVSAIHDIGAVHGDLKPSNILVGPGLRCVLIDFGLAHLRGELPDELSASLLGTPAYMAPELLTSTRVPEDIEDRSDVYALALIAYELLTGKPVFEAAGSIQMIAQQTMAEPERPSSHGAPASLDAPILAALHKNPDLRTPSVEALRRALLMGIKEHLSSSHQHMMIVHHDPGFRLKAESLLVNTFPELRVSTTDDYRELLAGIQDIDVVMVDLPDGELHTLEVVALARSRMKTRKTRIIASLSASHEWTRQLEVGADAFMVRPSVGQLIPLVQRLVYGENP